jgi:hypothetical protein
MKKTILSGLVFISAIISSHAQLYTPSGVIQGASGNDNVGIGTLSPNQKLQVNGNILLGSLNATLEMGNADSANSYGSIGFNNTTNDVVIKQKYTNGGIRFFTNTTVERMLIATNGNVGLGTAAPVEKLVVNGNVKLESLNATLEMGNGNPLVSFGSIGFNNVTNDVDIKQKYTDGGIRFFTNNSVERMAITMNGKVGIGTTTPDAKLAVNGDIHATEVRVTLTVPAPDYVFASDYKLKTLKEVEDYINKNSHLPEIPSAKELEKNGLLLAEMNMSLLKKVEELTLYAIEQEKKTEALMLFTKEQEKRMKIQLEAIEILKKENERFKNLSERLSVIEKELENNTIHSK